MATKERTVRAARSRKRGKRAERLDHASLSDEIMAISRRCAALPRKTSRASDEIIGYDERGLPDGW